MIVIGLMMEAQTAIRRSRKQKNTGTLARLRIKQVARKFSRFRLFFEEMFETLKLIQND